MSAFTISFIPQRLLGQVYLREQWFETSVLWCEIFVGRRIHRTNTLVELEHRCCRRFAPYFQCNYCRTRKHVEAIRKEERADSYIYHRAPALERDCIRFTAELTADAELAVPTLDHYLPLVYAVALQEKGEPIEFAHEGIQHGSISMRCLQIG